MNSIDQLIRRFQSLDVARLTQAVALGIFLIGAIVSYILTNLAMTSIDRAYESRLSQHAAAMRSHVNFKFRQYDQLLKTSAAFSNISEGPMTRELWNEYVEKSKVLSTQPTILGLGYVEVVAQDELASYEQRMSGEHSRMIFVNPEGERDTYAPISFLESENDVNTTAIGYDMSSEESRQTAMSNARDSHNTALTGPVRLVQDEERLDVYGVLIYYPVYAAEEEIDTVEQRRDALEGFVYIPVRPSDIALRIDSQTVEEDAGFEIRDDDKLVFARNVSPTSIASDQTTLDVYGRTWHVTAFVNKDHFGYWATLAAIMIIGTVSSGLLAVMVYGLLSRRIDHLMREHDDTLETTKNELVMLASHQLRTPASGVKQYLGMLIEGLLGTIDDRHLGVIQKAYNANERQIETIDQILHVAKADAGQMALRYSSVDMTELVDGVVENATTEARRKNIILTTELADDVEVMCDKRYLTMAVENLVSNAIKYSYPDSTVTMSLRANTRTATIEIADHGVGINEEDIERLFDKFVRIDNPLSVQEGGTGLGLFLAQQIAHAHQGSVSVRPNGTTGSVFTLKIPVRKPSH